MNDNTVLLNCFKSLNKRLYQIRNNTCRWEYEFQKSTIDEIFLNGIYNQEMEDVIDFVYSILPDIESISNDIDAILENQDIKPIYVTEEKFPFRKTGKLSSKEIKAKLKKDIIVELEYYTDKLNDLKKTMEIKLDRFGLKNYANARMQLRLELTVEEIGCLFGLIYECHIIDNEKVSKIHHR